MAIHVRLRYSGRAYDLAGHIPEKLQLEDGSDVSAALAAVKALLPPDKPLPPTCLVAVNGAHLGTVVAHTNRALNDGDEILLIAPVAGG